MNSITQALLLALLVALPLSAAPVLSSARTAGAPQTASDASALPAVLITGASTGIGRRTAEHLAKNGFFVYAGARKDKDMAELNELENVQAIRLDVTSPEQIAAAVKTVEEAGRGLHGLINNAGVVVMAPLTEVTEEDLDFQMDVNVFGPYRVTKAFSELLIENGGRVSTTGSISGVLTWGLGGPYTMSKHAIEAYTDCLAAELEPLGVRCSVVDPGNFRSRIFDSMVERMKAKGYTGKGSRYEERFRGILEDGIDRSNEADPLPVAEAFLHAMKSESPKLRYLVTPNENQANRTIQAVLRRAVELNRDQKHELSREQLHQLLDRTLDAEGQ